MLLPVTSTDTLCANCSASARQARDAAVSKPDGAGASSKRFRKASDEGLIIGDPMVDQVGMLAGAFARRKSTFGHGADGRATAVNVTATAPHAIHISRNRTSRRSSLRNLRYRWRHPHRSRAALLRTHGSGVR